MTNADINKFKAKFNNFIFEKYPQNSRIHKLFKLTSKEAAVFIKRDDELGFGASGSKIRKYLSLIPFIKKENFNEVIVIGSSHSNNILTATQLLIENEISPILFLFGNKKENLTGNYLLTRLFVDQKSIYWIENSILEIEKSIANYINEKKLVNKKVGYIPEGAFCPEALPGACTLALDIIKNEVEYNTEFNHIFIDAGTGFIAISLILSFVFLKKNTIIHVLLLSGNQDSFNSNLEILKVEFEKKFDKITNNNFNYLLYFPSNAKSFGSTNSQTFHEIKKISIEYGIIKDQIYSSKLFYESRKIITESKLKGNILIIHSGGGLSLFGFENKIVKLTTS